VRAEPAAGVSELNSRAGYFVSVGSLLIFAVSGLVHDGLERLGLRNDQQSERRWLWLGRGSGRMPAPYPAGALPWRERAGVAHRLIALLACAP
jgi:hypothetical protein